jgi:hypothetical protein
VSSDIKVVGGPLDGAVVANAVFVQVMSNPPAAPCCAVLRITIVYNSTFDLGAGEPWKLQIKQTSTTKQCTGFIATDIDNPEPPPDPPIDQVDELVTRPKIQLTESALHDGEFTRGALRTYQPIALPTRIEVLDMGTRPSRYTRVFRPAPVVMSTDRVHPDIEEPYRRPEYVAKMSDAAVLFTHRYL